MHALPSGTVTFLFTDIEGSTKLRARSRSSKLSTMPSHAEAWRAGGSGLTAKLAGWTRVFSTCCNRFVADAHGCRSHAGADRRWSTSARGRRFVVADDVW